MKIKPYTDGTQVVGYSFYCPGCKCRHSVVVRGAGAWGWNGSTETPTFTPSVLVRMGHFADGNSKECYCTWEARYPDKGPPRYHCGICHSFVRDGKIQFLPDCTHALAGQTVDLPDIPSHEGIDL